MREVAYRLRSESQIIRKTQHQVGVPRYQRDQNMFIFWMLLWLIDTAQGEALITDKKVTCTSSNIEVALTFAKSFSGGVLTENPRKYEQCRWKGNGSNSMSINIPLFNSTKCAVVANEVCEK
nr:hypothetical protein F13B9.6 - Caenorhabditis elegans [Caenorhabditis elegans]